MQRKASTIDDCERALMARLVEQALCPGTRFHADIFGYRAVAPTAEGTVSCFPEGGTSRWGKGHHPGSAGHRVPEPSKRRVKDVTRPRYRIC